MALPAAKVTLLKISMPVLATIRPELAMLPENVEIVTSPLPPRKMPRVPAKIVPELLIPPEKAEIVTDAVMALDEQKAREMFSEFAAAGGRLTTSAAVLQNRGREEV